jgi:hypothetical protein
MRYFTQRIQVQNHVLLFFFDNRTNSEEKCYCITTIDWYDKVHILNIREAEDKWILDQTKDYPEWAISLEEKLSNLIKEKNHLWPRHMAY